VNRRQLLLLGVALTAARALRAQQKLMPAIGFLSSVPPEPAAPYLAAFRRELSEQGYIEEKSVAIEYRWAEGHYDRLPALAADLVGRKIDVIAASGDAAVLAAKSQTSTIPIVFFNGGDPVAMGLVASLARPGGNVTGFSTIAAELVPKRLSCFPSWFLRQRSWRCSYTRTIRMQSALLEICRKRRVRRACSSVSCGRVPKPRSTTSSHPSSNRASTGLSSVPTHCLSPGASRSWRWRHAMPCRRFMGAGSSSRPAA